MKRAQITLFIIAAICIIFVLGTAVFLLLLASEKEPVIPVDQGKGNIRVCLENSVSIAVRTLAEQGGTEQRLLTNGVTVQPSPVLPPTKLHLAMTACPPIPPGEYVKDLTRTGVLDIEPLCSLSGPNRPNAGNNHKNDCLPGTYQLGEPDNEVLQLEIAALAEQNALGCGLNESIKILLGADDITATAANVSVNIPVRFKRVYNLGFMLSLADAKDIYFDKKTANIPGCSEPGASNECLLAGLHAQTTPVPDAEVTIITVTDSARKLQGTPFTYEFAIDNRPPSITKITAGSQKINPWQPILLESQETYTLTVETADPDEDDEVYVACCGPPWMSCNTVYEGSRATTTITMQACDNESTITGALGLQANDGSWFTNIAIPVLISPQADLCPVPSYAPTQSACAVPLWWYLPQYTCGPIEGISGVPNPYGDTDEPCEPEPEWCNNQDDDCNGLVDDGIVCPASPTCVPDGQVDASIYNSHCCSGRVVRGSLICDQAADYFGSFATCTQICGRTGTAAPFCPYGPTGTEWCPCPAGTQWNGSYVPGSCE